MTALFANWSRNGSRDCTCSPARAAHVLSSWWCSVAVRADDRNSGAAAAGSTATNAPAAIASTSPGWRNSRNGARVHGRIERTSHTGTGARLEYADIDPTFLELVRTTVTDETVALERDQSKRGYLHPVAGSAAARVGAGLFTSGGA